MSKAITGKRVATSFDKGINAVSWVLVRFIIAMVPVVFFINGFTKGDWLQALLFALSVAVGVTPEMLPMIVTTNLAKGAVAMSKKKTVVKSLNSMQNFGAMDILCTDKTGTITQNKVVLEMHLNVCGEEDPRVLYHAFLNSYYQTGLKNLTGDNDAITRFICKQVGINVDTLLLGSQIDQMDDQTLAVEMEKVSVFAKLAPQQKARIVKVLRGNGHTVGFLGDGINDAIAMREADVAISVDTAVDIAKESADI